MLTELGTHEPCVSRERPRFLFGEIALLGTVRGIRGPQRTPRWREPGSGSRSKGCDARYSVDECSANAFAMQNVLDEENAARSEQLRPIPKRRGGIGQVVQHGERGNAAARAGAQRRLSDICTDRGESWRPATSRGEHAAREVQRDHSEAALCEGASEAAGASAKIDGEPGPGGHPSQEPPLGRCQPAPDR